MSPALDPILEAATIELEAALDAISAADAVANLPQIAEHCRRAEALALAGAVIAAAR